MIFSLVYGINTPALVPVAPAEGVTTMKLMIYPSKLKEGDTLCLIAPSNGFGNYASELIERGRQALAGIGLKLVIPESLRRDHDALKRTSKVERARDIHDAFANPAYQGIICMAGGASSTMLLDDLDYSLIMRNPKPLIGHSDVTALLNGITSVTGLVTYYGPGLYNLGQRYGIASMLQDFRRCLMEVDSYLINSPGRFVDDLDSGTDPEDIVESVDPGPWCVENAGIATGRIWGGNLRTIVRLEPRHLPSLQDCVLFLESSGDSDAPALAMDFLQLARLTGFDSVKGVVLGRFQQKSSFTRARIRSMIAAAHEEGLPKGIPVIAGVNIGHTTPRSVFPVGGEVSIMASQGTDACTIKVYRH